MDKKSHIRQLGNHQKLAKTLLKKLIYFDCQATIQYQREVAEKKRYESLLSLTICAWELVFKT